MKMDKIAGSQNDEFYTPEYAILPLIEFLDFPSRIWCPFDTKDSIFIKVLKKAGHEVIHTHISDGFDFFNTAPPDNIDYIISNPPYSMKYEVFKRLFDLKIPFDMLVGVVGLFESKLRFELFKNNSFEIMYFDKRVSYFKDYEDKKPSLNPPFSSVYLCSGILPNPIMFKNIVKS